jgi:serine/threonine protein kinase
VRLGGPKAQRPVIRADGSTVDHYELLEFLGEGAQAEVHRAKDLFDGSEVVIKFPRAHVLHHPVLVARWRREAAITSGLYHQRIVCRRDSGELHSEPYIVLEYVDCGTLRGFIGDPTDPLPIAQALAWGRQLAEALVFLHGRGVVHQDLKPDNILVNTDLSLKLGDFGAAIAARPAAGRRSNHSLALPIPPEGTAGYLSPEQITGIPSDERSDIYSWGIVMYELLTGQLPFGPLPNGPLPNGPLPNGPLPNGPLPNGPVAGPSPTHSGGTYGGTTAVGTPRSLGGPNAPMQDRPPRDSGRVFGGIAAKISPRNLDGRVAPDLERRPADCSGVAPDPLAAMEAHLRDAPTTIRTLRPDVPPAVEGVVMTAMRRHPGHRYQTAAGLLADLERLDSLDPTSFDLSPEEPITTPVGGAELSALLHLIVLTALGFLGLASVAVAFTAILH